MSCYVGSWYAGLNSPHSLWSDIGKPWGLSSFKHGGMVILISVIWSSTGKLSHRTKRFNITVSFDSMTSLSTTSAFPFSFLIFLDKGKRTDLEMSYFRGPLFTTPRWLSENIMTNLPLTASTTMTMPQLSNLSTCEWPMCAFLANTAQTGRYALRGL